MQQILLCKDRPSRAQSAWRVGVEYHIQAGPEFLHALYMCWDGRRVGCGGVRGRQGRGEGRGGG